MSSRKRYLLFGAALLAGILLVLAFRPQPVAVSVAEVTRGPLQVTIEQEGKTRVQERYVVSAPVTGYAPRLDLEVGDPVQAGQPLLLLQPVPATLLDARTRAEVEARAAQAEAALRREQSQLNAAKAANELAQAEYQRARQLYERGDIALSTLDARQAEAQQAAANLRSARFAVDVARQELAAARAAVQVTAAGSQGKPVEEVPVVSPVSGRVLAIAHKSLDVVSSGQPLLTVGDPHALEVEIDVLSTDAVQIRPGMRVLLARWGGGEALEGRVRTVEPSAFTKVSALGVEEQRVWVIADIVSPRALWEGLGDGYRVEARFVVWSADDVLQAPTSALFRKEEAWTVFVVQEGVARARPVVIGRRSALAAQILEGLEPGERVITHPDLSIEDGTRVTPQQG